VLELVSGGGYYVRSLARDLGRATGAFGHLTKLRRTAIGPWRDPESGRPQVKGTALYPWCPSVEITQGELDRLRAGKELDSRPVRAPEWKLPDGFPDPSAPIRAYLDGGLVAMLREKDGKLAAAPVLRGPM